MIPLTDTATARFSQFLSISQSGLSVKIFERGGVTFQNVHTTPATLRVLTDEVRTVARHLQILPKEVAIIPQGGLFVDGEHLVCADSTQFEVRPIARVEVRPAQIHKRIDGMLVFAELEDANVLDVFGEDVLALDRKTGNLFEVVTVLPLHLEGIATVKEHLLFDAWQRSLQRTGVTYMPRRYADSKLVPNLVEALFKRVARFTL